MGRRYDLQFDVGPLVLYLFVTIVTILVSVVRLKQFGESSNGATSLDLDSIEFSANPVSEAEHTNLSFAVTSPQALDCIQAKAHRHWKSRASKYKNVARAPKDENLYANDTSVYTLNL